METSFASIDRSSVPDDSATLPHELPVYSPDPTFDRLVITSVANTPSLEAQPPTYTFPSETQNSSNTFTNSRQNDSIPNSGGNPSHQPNARNRDTTRRFPSLVDTWRRSSYFFILFYFPIIVLAITLLLTEWEEGLDCSEPLNYWLVILALLYAIMLGISVRVVSLLPSGRAPPGIEEIRIRRAWMYFVLLRIIDLFWFAWFVAGGVWVFRADCPSGSNIYRACIALFIIHIILIICSCCTCCYACCNVMVQLQLAADASKTKTVGATKTEISKLRQEKFKEGLVCADDTTCAICLANYETDEEIRFLPCNHHFHTECVDQWLEINATCPFCKRSVNGKDEEVKEQV
eukprot:TRINITY_DN7438_c0_g1_i1.p1 TRINITY_DN7438_c0_g1~~TRINITY_DN7438_c0_g1_i1.p1  ORF type:complete len:347 (-),score=36.12 TRINITY_DN7438_c0_g1_i1:69-1109(-)